jgi:hypothetical protein
VYVRDILAEFSSYAVPAIHRGKDFRPGDNLQRTVQDQREDLAETAFHECLKVRSNDGPSRVLLERIHFLRRNPPGDNWNGVWHLRQK